MEKINDLMIGTVARVMAESFMTDPMNAAQLEGVGKKKELLKAHSYLHAKYALNSHSLNLLDGDPRAFLIGFDSKMKSRLNEMLLFLRIFLATIQILNLKELIRLIKNMKRNGAVLSFNWHNHFFTGRHYRIKIIAVDKELRGTGAFRKLITPYLGFVDKEQIPMVLETHNSNNVGIYEHFGFKLVKTITAPNTDIVQYCMIRRPEANQIMTSVRKNRRPMIHDSLFQTSSNCYANCSSGKILENIIARIAFVHD
jgi:GNAT superfamily N-acetyltransferase